MLSRVPWPYREEHAREWIDAPHDPHLPNLLITLPEEGGRIVGCVGLHDGRGAGRGRLLDRARPLGPRLRDRGAERLLSLARLAGHRRIVSRHAADNPASGRVLRKAGFRPTGRARPFRSLGRDTASWSRPSTRSTSRRRTDEATLDEPELSAGSSRIAGGTARPPRAPAGRLRVAESRQHQLLLHFGQQFLAAADAGGEVRARAVHALGDHFGDEPVIEEGGRR
jgi:RimJ/RimL family protein N-acetyltransferase